MKISNEEIRIIRGNLVALGLLTRTYDLSHDTTILRITKKGMQMYATLLHLLGENKLFDAPVLSKDEIEPNILNSLRDLIFEQKFVEFIALSDDKYALTHRGAEHIKIMFKTNMKPHISLTVKICKLFKQLKG